MQSLQKRSVCIVWFKRDLRSAMNHALLQGAGAEWPVLPLYIVEPEYWSQPDASYRHYQFMSECLAELRDDLAAIGQPLIVRVGEARDVLEQLSNHVQIRLMFSHEETGNAWTFERDKAVQAWCRERGVPWTEIWQNGVVRRLKNRNGWASNWSQRMRAHVFDGPLSLQHLPELEPGPMPIAGDLGLIEDGCKYRQRGGRRAGLEKLQSFLKHRGLHYRSKMSSPVTGFNACSRISSYLAFGSLSLQEAAQATAKQRLVVKARGGRGDPWRGSLSSFEGRLHWHCHFIQKLEAQPAIEFEDFHPFMRGLRCADDERLAAWAEGRTGVPFMDACMRALRAHGWINFRMRAMLMSFASYHLWLPWRDSGLHLARQFVDYEPGIHWSQCQMQSGSTAINAVRVYNPIKQGQDHDLKGEFIRTWLPELQLVPDVYVHEPWKLSMAAQRQAGLMLGVDYPLPVVEPALAAREAKQRIWAIRERSGFSAIADGIHQRHGSRRSGLAPTGQGRRRRRRNPAPDDSQQLTLDL